MKANSQQVQSEVRRHYQWLKKFWTPTQESYSKHGQFMLETDLRKTYEAYHPRLAAFLTEAIQIFAKHELS